jgi:diacylglycerol kinase (ATP)
MNNTKPTPKIGLARIWAAGIYSVSGFKRAFVQEAAFRQECLLFGLLLIPLTLLPLDITWKALLLLAQSFILIVEILNSAIESVVDLASPEYHDLAKGAKDMGSAAVLMTIVVCGALWVLALSQYFIG